MEYSTESRPVARPVQFQPDLVIGGGQCGADYGGLLGACGCRIPTGGFAPKGYRTEIGLRLNLSGFGLIESESDDYAVRTRQNCEISDAILVIALDFESPGTKLTRELARRMGKPLFQVGYSRRDEWKPYLAVEDVRGWLNYHRPCVLMIAGNRESIAPGIEEWTRRFVTKVFS